MDSPAVPASANSPESWAAMNKPTHPVELICCAIATQEGWFGPASNIPVLRNNPGDLRFAHQANATRPDGTTYGNLAAEPVAVFTCPETGICGLFRDIWAKVAAGETLAQMISVYAPPNENNTSAYLEDVLQWTGLPANVPILQLLPPLVKMPLDSAA